MNTAPTNMTQTSDLASPRGARRMPFLVGAGSAVHAGAATPPRFFSCHAGLEVGRRPSPAAAGAWVVADPSVSGRHARIVPTPDGFAVEDLGSKNGTVVDGVRIEGTALLRDGSVLLFGGSAAVFRLVSDEDKRAIDAELASPMGPVPGVAPRMANALRRLKQLAPTGEDIFLVGETGVGKEVYARAIHAASGRQGKLVALNCAAVPAELVESELFGFVRGAHSQATHAKKGLIEEAAGGTLFLDEVGDMAPAAQAKLLRFVQEREITPLGATLARRIDVRVVAATSRADANEHSPGLREDLRGRLGAEAIVLPPLRERPEDVGPLACHFLAKRGLVPFTAGAFLRLLSYAWPRNVRELEKVIAAGAIGAAETGVIGIEHLPAGIGEPAVPSEGPARGPRTPRAALTREELEALLAKHRGNVADAAREIDRQWAVVRRWIVRYGIDMNRYRG